MSLSYPLMVEQLEDRCVPAVTLPMFQGLLHNPRLDATITVSVEPGHSASVPQVLHFVIDAYPINPSAPTAPPRPMTFDFTIPLPRWFNVGNPPPPPTDTTPPPDRTPPPPDTTPPPTNT